MKVSMYTGPKMITTTEVDSKELTSGEVRIKTLYSGISHGTEMNIYRGYAPFFEKEYNPETRLFEKADKDKTWNYPFKSCDDGVWYLGYAAVGKIVEVYEDVTKVSVGDIVYTAGPHQSEIVTSQDAVKILPKDINPMFGVVFTNLVTGFNGILDASIKLGDVVVVMGLGVIGQMVSQMAQMSGAKVVGVDLIEKRREVALKNGIDYVFDPSKDDVAMEVRKLTNMKGADVVIDLSGSYHALNDAIRIVAPEQTVVALSWYPGESKVYLADEFHHNRVKIKCSQTNHTAPEFAELWGIDRKEKQCMEILPKLKLDNIVSDIYMFDNIAEAYETIDKRNHDVIQCVLKYDE